MHIVEKLILVKIKATCVHPHQQFTSSQPAVGDYSEFSTQIFSIKAHSF